MSSEHKTHTVKTILSLVKTIDEEAARKEAAGEEPDIAGAVLVMVLRNWMDTIVMIKDHGPIMEEIYKDSLRLQFAYYEFVTAVQEHSKNGKVPDELLGLLWAMMRLKDANQAAQPTEKPDLPILMPSDGKIH